ncbi:MAG: hypothetical protein PHG05_00305 [Candidatus Nanoarchaeia archaeon]|nr:hypothetical protein [Candidatus Nanoarchaeia archaeon]
MIRKCLFGIVCILIVLPIVTGDSQFFLRVDPSGNLILEDQSGEQEVPTQLVGVYNQIKGFLKSGVKIGNLVVDEKGKVVDASIDVKNSLTLGNLVGIKLKDSWIIVRNVRFEKQDGLTKITLKKEGSIELNIEKVVEKDGKEEKIILKSLYDSKNFDPNSWIKLNGEGEVLESELLGKKIDLSVIPEGKLFGIKDLEIIDGKLVIKGNQITGHFRAFLGEDSIKVGGLEKGSGSITILNGKLDKISSNTKVDFNGFIFRVKGPEVNMYYDNNFDYSKHEDENYFAQGSAKIWAGGSGFSFNLVEGNKIFPEFIDSIIIYASPLTKKTLFEVSVNGGRIEINKKEGINQEQRDKKPIFWMLAKLKTYIDSGEGLDEALKETYNDLGKDKTMYDFSVAGGSEALHQYNFWEELLNSKVIQNREEFESIIDSEIKKLETTYGKEELEKVEEVYYPKIKVVYGGGGASSIHSVLEEKLSAEEVGPILDSCFFYFQLTGYYNVMKNSIITEEWNGDSIRSKTGNLLVPANLRDLREDYVRNNIKYDDDYMLPFFPLNIEAERVGETLHYNILGMDEEEDEENNARLDEEAIYNQEKVSKYLFGYPFDISVEGDVELTDGRVKVSSSEEDVLFSFNKENPDLVSYDFVLNNQYVLDEFLLSNKEGGVILDVSYPWEKTIQRGIDVDPIVIKNVKKNIQEQWGVRPRSYFGFLNEKYVEDDLARWIYEASDSANNNKYGIKVAPSEVFVTYMAEGGAVVSTYYFGHNVPAGGYLYLGLDTLGDKNEQRRLMDGRFIPSTLRIESIKSIMNQADTERVTPAEFETLRDGLIAVAGVFAQRKYSFLSDFKDLYGEEELNKLTDDEIFFWSSLYYNAGESLGKKFLKQRTKVYFPWSGGEPKPDDSGGYELKNPRLNSLIRMTTRKWLEDCGVF